MTNHLIIVNIVRAFVVIGEIIAAGTVVVVSGVAGGSSGSRWRKGPLDRRRGVVVVAAGQLLVEAFVANAYRSFADRLKEQTLRRTARTHDTATSTAVVLK